MSSSKVQIANMALGLVGVSQSISSIDEASAPAKAVKRYWDFVVDEALACRPWSFAKDYSALSLVEESPNTEWKYAYAFPSDCLVVRKILNPNGRQYIGASDPWSSDYRNSVAGGADPTRIPFTRGVLGTKKVIFTDQPDAVVEYTKRLEDTSMYPPLFVVALAHKLAALAGTSVAMGDPHGLVKRVEERVEEKVEEAFSADCNEEQRDSEPEPEFIRAMR